MLRTAVPSNWAFVPSMLPCAQGAARSRRRRGDGGALRPRVLPDASLSRGAFQAALEQLGRQGIVELALVIGNYSLLALINSFDTDLPPDRTEPLLPV